MALKSLKDYLEQKPRSQKVGLPIFLAVLAAAILLGLLTNSMLDEVYPVSETVTTDEKFSQFGTRENTNGISVANLYGTWQEMGQRYGELFAPELKEILEDKILPPVKDSAKQQAKLQETAQTVYQNYPARLKQFLRGMAVGSGLTEDQLLLINAVETIYTNEDKQEPASSAIAVWDDYAKDRKLVYGRNYDYEPLFRTFANDVVVTIYHPSDGSIPTATVGYIGEIYCTTGMNANGLFLDLNNGTPSLQEKKPEYLSSSAQLLSLLFDAENQDYVESFFSTVLCESSFLIGVADAEEARSYEWCTRGVKRGGTDEPNGVMVQTNHFVNDEWDFPMPSDEQCWNSLTRRNNLLTLADKYKGTIDAQRMKELLELSIEQGGVTGDYTVYQVIAIPEDLTLIVRDMDCVDWTSIDLRPYFFSDMVK